MTSTEDYRSTEDYQSTDTAAMGTRLGGANSSQWPGSNRHSAFGNNPQFNAPPTPPADSSHDSPNLSITQTSPRRDLSSSSSSGLSQDQIGSPGSRRDALENYSFGTLYGPPQHFRNAPPDKPDAGGFLGSALVVALFLALCGLCCLCVKRCCCKAKKASTASQQSARNPAAAKNTSAAAPHQPASANAPPQTAAPSPAVAQQPSAQDPHAVVVPQNHIALDRPSAPPSYIDAMKAYYQQVGMCPPPSR